MEPDHTGLQAPGEDFNLNLTSKHWALALPSFATLGELSNCSVPHFLTKMRITVVPISRGRQDSVSITSQGSVGFWYLYSNQAGWSRTWERW